MVLWKVLAVFVHFAFEMVCQSLVLELGIVLVVELCLHTL